MLKTTVTVHVSQDHIDKEIVGNCFMCPISRAILDRLKITFVDTMLSVAEEGVTFHSENTVSDLPKEAWKFIWDFDSGISVKPFSFRLEVPESLVPREFV